MFAFHMYWESSPVSPDELNALFMWLWHSVTLFSFFIQISFAGSPCKSGTHLSVIYAQAAILIKHAWRLCFLSANPKRYKNSQWMTGKEHRLQSDWACGGHWDLSFSSWWQDKKKSHNSLDLKRIPSILPKWFLSLKDWPDTMYQSSISCCSTSLMDTDNCLLSLKYFHAESNKCNREGEAELTVCHKRQVISFQGFCLCGLPQEGSVCTKRCI